MIYLALDAIFEKHKTPIGHPESPLRIRKIFEEYEKSPLKNKITIVNASKASEEHVMLVHSPDHVEYIKALCRVGGGAITADTNVSEETYDVALYAIGTTIKMAELALKKGEGVYFAAVRPPGHHATKDLSKGFCIFNNIAITAEYLRTHHKINRIVILDFDVHHGDGTQSIFYSDSTVLYISLHQDPRTLYPGTGFPEEVGYGEGEGYTINIPLPPGLSSDGYLRAFSEIVEPIVQQYKPDVILVSAGFDGHHDDTISDMNLQVETYWHLGKKIYSLVKVCSVKAVVSVLEGGYSLKYMPKSLLNYILAPVTSKPVYNEGKLLLLESRKAELRLQRYLNRVRKVLSEYWNLS